jgi:hypothetical protein
MYMTKSWNVFALDHRSVRLFRLMLGFGLVVQMISLLWSVGDFYTDDGVLSRRFLSLVGRSSGFFSPFMWSGGWWWPALLISLIALLGGLLIYDIYPRLVSLLAFLLLLSLHHRNPLIIYGVDDLAAMLTFWSIFLPSTRRKGEAEVFFSGVSLAVVMQVAMFYAVVGFSKSTESWWHNPIASYIALQGDALTTLAGKFFAGFPRLLEFGTRIVLICERGLWIFLLCPGRKGAWRLAMVLPLAGMHVLFGLCMHLGLFPYFDLVLLALVTPPWFWDQFATSRHFLPPVAAAPTAPVRWWEAVSEPLAMAAVAVFIWTALSNMPFTEKVRLSKDLRKWQASWGLTQSWQMFAPDPYRDDGWWVSVGWTESGAEVDLFSLQTGPVSFLRPRDAFLHSGGERWATFMFGLQTELMAFLRPSLVDFMCRRWGTAHREPLVEVQLYFVGERTKPPGEPMTIKPRLMRRTSCSGVPLTGPVRVPSGFALLSDGHKPAAPAPGP